MEITFLGAAGQVTGSKTLIEIDKEKYLVDYGLVQGGKQKREQNWEPFREADQLNAVFLTHAHIDHSGLLPRLYRDGFRGKIYCSRDTFALCKILLIDSAKIHQEDADFINKRNCSSHKPALPLYTEKEAEEVLTLFEPVEFNEKIKVSDYIAITFHWAGHILGASYCDIEFKTDQGPKNIVFSGDLGHERNVLLTPPEPLCKCDFLVLESTYGNRLHPRLSPKEVLGIFLKTIIKRGGVAVIPSFSVGRTQDILYLIKCLIDDKTIPRVSVYLDSPLSKKANSIFQRSFNESNIKKEIFEKGKVFPDTLIEIETVKDSKDLNNKSGEPMIIVSASGMIDGGRVVHHIKGRIEDKKNGVILVGYQPEGTKGRILLDGEKMLRLHKEEFTVKADIFYVDTLSAHADYLDTINWLKKSEHLPKFIILNHGEKNSLSNLKTLVEAEFQITTTIAEMNEGFKLDVMV